MTHPTTTTTPHVKCDADIARLGRASEYSIERIEVLCHEALAEEVKHLRQAQRFEAAGLVNTARCARKLADQAHGRAEAYDIATAVIAGAFK